MDAERRPKLWMKFRESSRGTDSPIPDYPEIQDLIPRLHRILKTLELL